MQFTEIAQKLDWDLFVFTGRLHVVTQATPRMPATTARQRIRLFELLSWNYPTGLCGPVQLDFCEPYAIKVWRISQAAVWVV